MCFYLFTTTRSVLPHATSCCYKLSCGVNLIFKHIFLEISTFFKQSTFNFSLIVVDGKYI